MKYLLYVIVMFGTLLSNPITLAKGLTKKEIPLNYYYWKDEKGVYYLGKNRNNGTYSIWIYTKERKWKPFHNADGFDGFPKAGQIYKTVSFNNGNIILESMNASSDDDSTEENNDNLTPPTPFNSNLDTFENHSEMFKVEYYFWINEEGVAFLSKIKDKENPSIWNYTLDRKWVPLYNANTFDGFSGIKNTFDDVRIDSTNSKIIIGNFVNHLQDDFKLKLNSQSFSNSIGNGNNLTSNFLKKTPQFYWTYDEQYKTINEAFILQITDKKGKLIYSTLLSKDDNYTKEGRSINDTTLPLPSSSFCEKQYRPIPPTGETKIMYIAYIYGVYDISITNQKTCLMDIAKKENYLAKSALEMFLLVNDTVIVNSSLAYKDDKYLEGEIVLTFEDVVLKNPTDDIKNHIKITNLPSDFDINQDLKISHKVIGKTSLTITINKTEIQLEDRIVHIEFLDTLFIDTPNKIQQATIEIRDYSPPTISNPSLPEK